MKYTCVKGDCVHSNTDEWLDCAFCHVTFESEVGEIMNDWLVTHLNGRERLMYRIAMRNAKDPEKVDEEFFINFAREQNGCENKQDLLIPLEEGYFPPPWSITEYPEKTEGWCAYQDAMRNQLNKKSKTMF